MHQCSAAAYVAPSRTPFASPSTGGCRTQPTRRRAGLHLTAPVRGQR